MFSVLIVDDDPAIREIFTAYLKMGGYAVTAVAGGRECLDFLATGNADLILLDLMMEPMDGWETLSAIRNHPAAGHIPVIIITGKQPVPEDILHYGSQIDDFFVKPVEFDKLVENLHRIIEKARDLDRMSEQKKGEGHDPLLIAEYTRILRFLRIAHKLARRFRDFPWAARLSLHSQEERLISLHSQLGFPDHLPDWTG
jgi:two-component system, OmpR family, response regulator